MTAGEAIVELTGLTGMGERDLRDFLNLPASAQAAALEGYKAQDWTRRGTGAGVAVLELLTFLATLAADVSGVAGAGSAIAALTKL